ncbi:hypothetical protein QU24_26295 [Pantoea rodasii]|uniref:Uncharacterized protein n=1 Tax=Pantoea rodasii TaxID=1076549 RepID=A0A0B1QXK3_9GAMM|nr:hypothetical protein QU24_26295 [Pantoea rodasii]
MILHEGKVCSVAARQLTEKITEAFHRSLPYSRAKRLNLNVTDRRWNTKLAEDMLKRLRMRRLEPFTDNTVSLLFKIQGLQRQALARLIPAPAFTIGKIPDFWGMLVTLDPVKTFLHFRTPAFSASSFHQQVSVFIRTQTRAMTEIRPLKSYRVG